MRRRLSLLTPVVLALLGATGCASTGLEQSRHVARLRAIPLAQRQMFGDYSLIPGPNQPNDADNDDYKGPVDRDYDTDGDSTHYFDEDDNAALGWGRPASSADRIVLSDLVRSYYAEAAQADGTSACSHLIIPVAKSIPETLGRPPGPSYLHGRSCPEVLRRMFVHFQSQVTTYHEHMRIAAVRVSGSNAVIVMAFAIVPGRTIRASKENGTWGLVAPLDSELP